MVTLNNIAKPVFWTLTSRLNANLGVDDIALPTLRTGGGGGQLYNNQQLNTQNQKMKPFILPFFMSSSHRNRLIRKSRTSESRATSGNIDL